MYKRIFATIWEGEIMKTGIVFEIKNGKATILKSGGEFITIPAKAHWKKGDIVRAESNRLNLKLVYSVAACFLLFISAATFAHSLYFNEIALISLDINPSIELGINVFDRVIFVSALNHDAVILINDSKIKNRKIDKAIEALHNNGLESYISDNSYIIFTIFSESSDKESYLLKELKDTTDTLLRSRHEATKVELYSVGKDLVEEAHENHVTAGKYMTLLQLKEVLPGMDINEYSHHSIGEIKAEINKHSLEHSIKHSVDHNASTQLNKPKDSEKNHHETEH